jgi:hypothetical protein
MIAPNIFTFSTTNLVSWTAAYAILEPFSYYLFPALFKAQTTQDYYNPKKFPFPIVAFGDYIYSTILYLIAQQIIPRVLATSAAGIPTVGAWLLHFLVFTVIQWVGDLSFWNIIKRLKPTTRYIDFFQRYGKEVGVGAPIGDTLYGILLLGLTQLVASNFPLWASLLAISVFMFGTLIVSW